MIRQHFACMMSCKHSSILIPNNFYYECYVYYHVNIALDLNLGVLFQQNFKRKYYILKMEKKNPLNFGTLKII